jgi:hypothetical protein
MTNWFEQYYDELVRCAAKRIIELNIIADAHEIVNDEYLAFVESGDDFELTAIKKRIVSRAYSYIPEKTRKAALGSRLTNSGNFKEYSYRQPKRHNEWLACSRCNDPKPSAAFYTQKFDGYNYTFHICKDCCLKKKKEWFNCNRDTWNRYVRERRRIKNGGINGRAKKRKPQSHVEAVKTACINRANKAYYQRQKEQLTDAYIRKKLSYKIPSPTSEQIQAKREELLQKRRLTNTLIANRELQAT